MSIFCERTGQGALRCRGCQQRQDKSILACPGTGTPWKHCSVTVTKQRAFHEGIINLFTEVMLIAETDENTLDISNWRLPTQGGYTAHNIKYQSARALINQCPMLTTAQHALQFGKVHQPTIDKRLRTYHLRWHKNPEEKAAAWLRKLSSPYRMPLVSRCAIDTKSDTK